MVHGWSSSCCVNYHQPIHDSHDQLHWLRHKDYQHSNHNESCRCVNFPPLMRYAQGTELVNGPTLNRPTCKDAGAGRGWGTTALDNFGSLKKFSCESLNINLWSWDLIMWEGMCCMPWTSFLDLGYTDSSIHDVDGLSPLRTEGWAVRYSAPRYKVLPLRQHNWTTVQSWWCPKDRHHNCWFTSTAEHSNSWLQPTSNGIQQTSAGQLHAENVSRGE